MRARPLLALGAVVTVLGVAVAGTAPVAHTPGSGRTVAQQTTGGAMVVLGWAILAFGIHRFGRGGDAEDAGEVSAPRKD